MITKDTILVLIEILQSASGIFLGVGFAVFTLVYAFIQNKKDYLREVEDLLKNEGVSVTVLRKRNSGDKFIYMMSKISLDSIILVVISSLGLVLSYVLSLLCICEKMYLYILVGVVIIFLAMAVYSIRIAMKLFVRYKK